MAYAPDQNHNRITIRVWSSGSKYLKPMTWKSQGHVALQTYSGGERGQGIYVSFWPGGDNCNCIRMGLKVDYPHFHSRDDDDLLYGGEPPCTFDLYVLNVEAINAEFLKFQKSNFNWTVLGCTSFCKTNEKNCSGLVETLLNSGGMYALLRERSFNLMISKEMMLNSNTYVGSSSLNTELNSISDIPKAILLEISFKLAAGAISYYANWYTNRLSASGVHIASTPQKITELVSYTKKAETYFGIERARKIVADAINPKIPEHEVPRMPEIKSDPFVKRSKTPTPPDPTSLASSGPIDPHCKVCHCVNFPGDSICVMCFSTLEREKPPAPTPPPRIAAPKLVYPLCPLCTYVNLPKTKVCAMCQTPLKN